MQNWERWLFLQAGIDNRMLTTAFEPEAAASFVKHLPVDKRVDGEVGNMLKTFDPGSRYIVVDAGGNLQISRKLAYWIKV